MSAKGLSAMGRTRTPFGMRRLTEADFSTVGCSEVRPGSTSGLCPARNRFYDPDNPGVGTRAGVVKKATRNAATPLRCSPKAGMVLTEPELADRPAMTSWLEGVLQLQDMANVNQNCILAPALCEGPAALSVLWQEMEV